jgi:2-haloacid dehalogenase
MPPRAVCVDVMGTLFDLSEARRRLEALGAPPLALEAWFHRLLHTAVSVSMTGDFRPFPELAKPALESLLVQLDLPPEGAVEVLDALGELDAYDDAGPALERLAASGTRVVALTNGTEQNTRKLLARGGLETHVEQIITTESVGVYKPHPDVYGRAVTELRLPARDITLLAAHAWDVMGALAAGLGAVWVSRLERRWPLPLPQARTAADLDEAVEQILRA